MKNWNTQNESFVVVSNQLKEQDVVNYDFILELKNEELLKLDPHSEELTKKEQEMVKVEILENPWYFFREIVRIPVAGNSISFKANLLNINMIYMAINNINYISIAPRQSGKTVTVRCIELYRLLIKNNTNSLLLDRSFSDTKNSIRIIHDMDDLLPGYLKLDSKGRSQEQILTKNNNNTIRALPAPTNDHAADKLGRGMTCGYVSFDGFGSIRHNDILYSTLMPAWFCAKENSINNNIGYGISVLSHIPSWVELRQTREWDFFVNIFLRNSIFSEFFMYDMTIDELKKHIYDNTENDYVLIAYSWKELGHDEKWYKNMRRLFLGDIEKIAAEIDTKETLLRILDPEDDFE